jgi:hypothetical protein
MHLPMLFFLVEAQVHGPSGAFVQLSTTVTQRADCRLPVREEGAADLVTLKPPTLGGALGNTAVRDTAARIIGGHSPISRQLCARPRRVPKSRS